MTTILFWVSFSVTLVLLFAALYSGFFGRRHIGNRGGLYRRRLRARARCGGRRGQGFQQFDRYLNMFGPWAA